MPLSTRNESSHYRRSYILYCHIVISVDYPEIPVRYIKCLSTFIPKYSVAKPSAPELEMSLYTSQAKIAAPNAKALAEKVAALLPEYCAGGDDPLVVLLAPVVVPFVTKV